MLPNSGMGDLKKADVAESGVQAVSFTASSHIKATLVFNRLTCECKLSEWQRMKRGHGGRVTHLPAEIFSLTLIYIHQIQKTRNIVLHFARRQKRQACRKAPHAPLGLNPRDPSVIVRTCFKVTLELQFAPFYPLYLSNVLLHLRHACLSEVREACTAAIITAVRGLGSGPSRVGLGVIKATLQP